MIVCGENPEKSCGGFSPGRLESGPDDLLGCEDPGGHGLRDPFDLRKGRQVGDQASEILGHLRFDDAGRQLLRGPLRPLCAWR